LPEGENYLSLAIRQLRKTFRTAARLKEFLKFILAFLIYNDGVIMALDFAAIIGAVLYGMEQQQLIIFVIIVQVFNVVGAYVFGLMVDRQGGKRSLVASLLLMIGVVIWLFFNQTADGYFIIGSVAGFAMAGVQSVSRTMVAIYSPPGQSAEFFGLFSVAGRTSSFIGPTIFGLVAAEAALWYERGGQAVDLAEQSGLRLAILTIAAFFIIGLMVLSFVKMPGGREATVEGTESAA
jgi:UMF1 family MFS transporter